MRALAVALPLILAAPAAAQTGLPPLAYTQLRDPAQEAAARSLMETLRCLVCQGQSIADSDAELAGDMRDLVRRRIAAGEKPEHIRAWLVERYGDWVSYRPSSAPIAWPLWAAPLILLIFGAAIVAGRLKMKRS